MFFQIKTVTVIFNLFLNSFIKTVNCTKNSNYTLLKSNSSARTTLGLREFASFLNDQKPNKTFTYENIKKFEILQSRLMKIKRNKNCILSDEQKTIEKILEKVYKNEVLVLKAGQTLDNNFTEENLQKYLEVLSKFIEESNGLLFKHYDTLGEENKKYLKDCISKLEEQFNQPKNLFIYEKTGEKENKKRIDIISSALAKRKIRKIKRGLKMVGIILAVIFVLYLVFLVLKSLIKKSFD